MPTVCFLVVKSKIQLNVSIDAPERETRLAAASRPPNSALKKGLNGHHTSVYLLIISSTRLPASQVAHPPERPVAKRRKIQLRVVITGRRVQNPVRHKYYFIGPKRNGFYHRVDCRSSVHTIDHGMPKDKKSRHRQPRGLTMTVTDLSPFKATTAVVSFKHSTCRLSTGRGPRYRNTGGNITLST